MEINKTQANSFILAWLQNLAIKFPNSKFTYSYEEEYQEYFIYVLPTLLTEDENYCALENKFYDEFTLLYPTTPLTFIGEALQIYSPYIIVQGESYKE